MGVACSRSGCPARRSQGGTSPRAVASCSPRGAHPGRAPAFGIAFSGPHRAGRGHDRAAWLRERGAQIESGPEEYEYTPGYYAVFFYDPDAIKLEIVHRSGESDLVEEVRRLAARLERLERERG